MLNPLQSIGVGLTLASIYLIDRRDTLGDKLNKMRSGDKVNSQGEAAALLESSELDSVELLVQVRVSEMESKVEIFGGYYSRRGGFYQQS